MAQQPCDNDVEPPSITCPADVTMNVPFGQCFATINLPDPVVSDNCPGNIDVTTISTVVGNQFPLGESSVKFIATDVSGNTTFCKTFVTITGGIPYAITCNDQVTVQAGPTGSVTLVPEDVLEGGPYNCAQTFISIGTGGPQPSVTLTGAGTYTVVCWIQLPDGGFNQCWGSLIVEGPCASDVTAPVAICDLAAVAQSNTQGPNTARLFAQTLDDGSYDNCTANLTLRATLDVNASAPPASEYVDLVGTGDFEVALWAGDDAGNWAPPCITTVTAIPPKCDPDNTAPLCTAPADVTVTQEHYLSLNLDLDDSTQVANAFGAATVWDNCSETNVFVSISYQVELGPGGIPTSIQRSFWAFDQAFNDAPIVSQTITVLPAGASIHCPAWRYPGDATTDSIALVSSTTEFLASSYQDQIFLAACNKEKVRTQRTYNVIDWLFPVQNNTTLTLPALDLDNDGYTGDAYDVVIAGDEVWRVENGIAVQLMGAKSNFYNYIQDIRNNYLDTFDIKVQGTVFLDSSLNCAFDLGETKLTDWTVKAIGQSSNRVYEVKTLPSGFYTDYHYTLNVCPDDATVELSLDVPFNFGQTCPMIYTVAVAHNAPAVQDIPVQLEASCPLLSTSLSTWRLRPCFPGTYRVSYCNLSTQSVAGAHVQVALDSFINFQGTNIPGGTHLGGNVFEFPLGTLAPGFCGSFDIDFTLHCDAPVGLTHCSEAHIFPDTICGNFANWSGATLEATGYCDGDSVHLSLKNIGTGDMSNALEFVVVEDLIIYMATPFQLNQGEVREVSVPANGATWRIQSPQESGHPWGGTVATFVEGCGGLNQSGLGLTMPVSSSNPFNATDCMVSVSSFDPNDKYAVPEGYGIHHFIEKNTDIEYTIRFQNTGTDTAYNVVILDSLSAHLDIESIAPGASSHSYDFDILPGRTLRFAFDSIRLPDSSANLLASQGFVKYRVRQMPDNPDDTYILNRAGIYFDQNEVVLTNYTWHQVGSNFISVSADNPNNGLEKLKIYPNPASDMVWFESPGADFDGNFKLMNALGKTIRQQAIAGQKFRFEAGLLPPGAYFYAIEKQGVTLYAGKLLIGN